jgi:hypothetical protein
MASTKSLASEKVNPASMSMASFCQETKTGERKNPCSPAGKYCQLKPKFAAKTWWLLAMVNAAPVATIVFNTSRLVIIFSRFL